MLALAGSLAVPRVRGAALRLFRSSAVVETSRLGTARPWSGEVAEPAPALSLQVNEGPTAVTRRVPAEPADVPLSPPLRPGTVPKLADLDEARLIAVQEYPVALQRKGIGGRVQLLMWVGQDGMTEFPQIEKTSGLRNWIWRPCGRLGCCVPCQLLCWAKRWVRGCRFLSASSRLAVPIWPSPIPSTRHSTFPLSN